MIKNPFDWARRKLIDRRAGGIAEAQAATKTVREIATPKYVPVAAAAVTYSPEHYNRRMRRAHQRSEAKRFRG